MRPVIAWSLGFLTLNTFLFVILARIRAWHHHWILPAMAGWLSLELGILPALLPRFPVMAEALARAGLVSVTLMLAIFLARQETIVYDGCAGKEVAALGMALAAVLFRFYPRKTFPASFKALYAGLLLPVLVFWMIALFRRAPPGFWGPK